MRTRCRRWCVPFSSNLLSIVSQLTTTLNGNGRKRPLLLVSFHLAHHFHYFHTTYDFPKDNVLAIQVRNGFQCNKKLGSVLIRPIIGHAQETHASVQEKGCLVLEFSPHIPVLTVGWVNGFTAGSITLGKVAHLNNKVGHDAMDAASTIAQIFGRSTRSLFSRTQAAKVFTGQGRLVLEQLDDDATTARAVVYGEVQITSRTRSRGR